jgi:hypothetical protein
MKVRVGDLRRVIKEEYLNGVPEWQLRQDTSDFVEQIRKRIKGFILVNKSLTGVDRAEAIGAMNQVCDQLEEKVYDVLEDSLFNFTRKA